MIPFATPSILFCKQNFSTQHVNEEHFINIIILKHCQSCQRWKTHTLAFHLQKVRVHVATPVVYPVLLKAAGVGALSPSSDLQTPACARGTAALHPGKNPIFTCKHNTFIAKITRKVPFIHSQTNKDKGSRINGQ